MENIIKLLRKINEKNIERGLILESKGEYNNNPLEDLINTLELTKNSSMDIEKKLDFIEGSLSQIFYGSFVDIDEILSSRLTKYSCCLEKKFIDTKNNGVFEFDFDNRCLIKTSNYKKFHLNDEQFNGFVEKFFKIIN